MKIKILLASIGIFALTGCANVASPTMGLITMVKGPVAVGPLAKGTKTGRACAQNILGLLAQGDASIEAAKAAGGISEVATVDHDSKSFVVFGEFCTVVTGR